MDVVIRGASHHTRSGAGVNPVFADRASRRRPATDPHRIHLKPRLRFLNEERE